jgi:hypothetical protein
MDLKTGPRGPSAFAAGATVTCNFVSRPHGSGSTPKFTCALPSGRELKVRYGETNGEVYAQVVATRLLWALGFGANRMYPVKVVCHGCPPNPFKDRPAADGSTSRAAGVSSYILSAQLAVGANIVGVSATHTKLASHAAKFIHAPVVMSMSRPTYEQISKAVPPRNTLFK